MIYLQGVKQNSVDFLPLLYTGFNYCYLFIDIILS